MFGFYTYTFRSLFLSHFCSCTRFHFTRCCRRRCRHVYVCIKFGFHRSSSSRRRTHTQQLETFDRQRDCENCVQSVSPCNVTPCLMVLSYYFSLCIFFACFFTFLFFSLWLFSSLVSLSCFELIHHISNHFHFVFER